MLLLRTVVNLTSNLTVYEVTSALSWMEKCINNKLFPIRNQFMLNKVIKNFEILKYCKKYQR